MSKKDRKYEKEVERETLRKLRLENQKLEQDIRHGEAEEKRKEARELREQKDHQFKRQEEGRKESANTREELGLWHKSLVPTLIGLMTSLRFAGSVSNWVEAAMFYGLLTLCVSSTLVVTTRLVVKFVKRLGKN